MNGHLTSKIFSSKYKDVLLNTWRIFHLHLDEKTAYSYKDMSKTRSKKLLLCVITNDTVYFVNLIEHPETAYDFFQTNSLEIILENGWMNEIGFYEIPDYVAGSMTPQITNAKELFELYAKYRMNIGFDFNGKGYHSSFPICTSGHTTTSVRHLQNVKRTIHQILENNLFVDFNLSPMFDGVFGALVIRNVQGNNVLVNFV